MGLENMMKKECPYFKKEPGIEDGGGCNRTPRSYCNYWSREQRARCLHRRKKPHPEKCPECGSELVYFERFVDGGSYCCDDCDWQVPAFYDPRIECKKGG